MTLKSKELHLLGVPLGCGVTWVDRRREVLVLAGAEGSARVVLDTIASTGFLTSRNDTDTLLT